MSSTASKNVGLCLNWYGAFDRRDIDALMALFTDDAVVVVGAGGSSGAVDYSGTFTGSDEIRKYYTKRFATPDNPPGAVKPRCGFVANNYKEVGSWVVFWGTIGRAHYNGNYLHVWTVDSGRGLLARLDMYLEPFSRLPNI
jgi:hypothetical protein